MAWLLRDGTVLASIEIAGSGRQRRCGLLGRDDLEGGLWLEPARSVHTIGMRFDIDVAHLAPVDEGGASDEECWEVLDVVHMRRHRIGAWHRRARAVLEARAGAMSRWGLRVGDVVELRR